MATTTILCGNASTSVRICLSRSGTATTKCGRRKSSSSGGTRQKSQCNVRSSHSSATLLGHSNLFNTTSRRSISDLSRCNTGSNSCINFAPAIKKDGTLDNLRAFSSISSNSEKKTREERQFVLASVMAMVASGCTSMLLTSHYRDNSSQSESSLAAAVPQHPLIFPKKSHSLTMKADSATSAAGVASSVAATNLGVNGSAVNSHHQLKVMFPPSQKRKSEIVDNKTGSVQVGKPPPYNVSVRALRGGRLTMEDEYFVGEGGRFVAVFDGHGGKGVSQYLRDSLFKKYQEAFHQSLTASSKPKLATRIEAIRTAFEQSDEEVLQNTLLQDQGSTAVAVILHEHPNGEKTIISANVGDSRAILAKRRSASSQSVMAVDLTRDHKPNEEKERARILSMGERIEWDEYCFVHRIRNLSLSRAIGDKFAKPAVSGEVEIKSFPMGDNDEFLLLASDGLWDVMTSQEVVDFVEMRMKRKAREGYSVSETMKKERKKNMSRYIANEALRRGSADNTSVIIVWLKKDEEES